MPEINSGDTAWVLAAAALVLFMTPGLGFFYAGFTRSKNVLGTIMQRFIVMGIVGVLWVVIGYTLAFGPDQGGLIGDLDYVRPQGCRARAVRYLRDNGAPFEAFMIFQCDVRHHHARADHGRLR